MTTLTCHYIFELYLMVSHVFLSANYRIIIKPVSDDLSAESLKVCDTLIIEGVIDYHGKGSKHSWIIP